MRLSEEATEFHGAMSGEGDPEPAGSFVRDWVAIGLHKQHTLTVTIEEQRKSFLQYIDKAQHQDHVLLDLRNYRLDMMVWDGDSPHAIVEFKRSINVVDDVTRTSAILSVVPGLRGYIAICCVFHPKEKFSTYKTKLDTMTGGTRVGDVRMREPAKLFDRADSDDWCGMLAVQVKPRS